MHLVVVAGVSGVGKTTFRSRLARTLYRGYASSSLSGLALRYGLWRSYDESRRSFVLDGRGLCNALLSVLRQGGLILETHWVGFLGDCIPPTVRVSMYLLRADPYDVYLRLMRRGWSCKRVAENVAAELLGTIAAEVKELLSSRVDIGVREIVARNGSFVPRKGCCIDWLVEMDSARLERIFGIVEGGCGWV